MGSVHLRFPLFAFQPTSIGRINALQGEFVLAGIHRADKKLLKNRRQRRQFVVARAAETACMDQTMRISSTARPRNAERSRFNSFSEHIMRPRHFALGVLNTFHKLHQPITQTVRKLVCRARMVFDDLCLTANSAGASR